MMNINFQNSEKINLFISKMINPFLSGTLFIFIGIFLLTASIEPARALEVNLYGHDNFVDGTINERVNFGWMNQEPWLCVLNNNLCNYIVKNPNDTGSQNSNIFNIIDDVIENHAADVSIRMFEFRIETNTENTEFVKNESLHLKEELSNIHKTREILENNLKSGAISHETYTASLTQNERMEKNAIKQVTEMASIIRQKNGELSNEFEKISKEKDDRSDDGRSAKAIHTPKVTETSEPTKTSTKTLEPTKTPAKTPEPTKKPTDTPEPTKTPIKTPEPTNTPTKTPEPTNTPEAPEE
jgi:hypothetical protein